MATSEVKIWALPDEVLYHIFSKLDPEFVIKCVTKVCQRWKNVVAEEKLFWNNVQFIVDCDYFFDYGYIDESLAKETPGFVSQTEGIYVGEKDLDRIKVQNIKFTKVGQIYTHLNDYLFIRILESLRKNSCSIEIVEFFSCSASSEVIKFLRENFSEIKEIRFGINIQVANVFPYIEVSKFTNLTTLVAHDVKFKSSALRDLSRECEYLSSLWVLLCISLIEDDILYFLEKKKNTLKELGFGSSLNDNILNKLTECHSLEVLFATDASKVTDVCLKSFAFQSNLKYCSLHDAKVLPTTLKDIAGPNRKPDVFEHLKILDLTCYNQAEYFRMLYLENDNNREVVYSWDPNTNKPSRKMKSKVEITFNNPIERSIDQPYYSSSSKEHWMYRHCTKWEY